MIKHRLNKYLILFTIVIFIVLFPLIQEFTTIIKFNDLKGKFVPTPEVDFSLKNWFSGELQQSIESYILKESDIRKFLIPLNYQINYSFFNKTSNKNIFIGKDNYIFNNDILTSYLGKDLRGEDTVANELYKLKFVQDTLRKLNKELIFIIAPSKPSFCYDKLPEKIITNNKKDYKKNYDLFVDYFKRNNVRYVDFVSYFKSLKKQEKAPLLLFPPKGLHWSVYSTSIVIDSLVKYIENNKGSKFVTYNWSPIEVSDAKENDVDVENVLNLFFPIESPKLAYRYVQNVKHLNDSLKVLAIGDSFYGELYYNGLNKILPSSNEFWFYGRIIKSPDFNLENDLSCYQVDLATKVKKTDVILMLYNDANLKSLGFKMIDRLYRLYTNQSNKLPYDIEFFKLLEKRIAEYKKDKEKINQLKLKSVKKNIPLDSMIEVEAMVTLETDIWNRNIKINNKYGF